MRRISDAGKIREKRGTGTGANYKPWIQTGEFGSLGTTSNPIDWKTGRQVQLLSQAETIAWYLLRWDDDNLDVREQFPLDFEETQALAEQFSIKHPTDKNGNKKVMTTDFLVTRRDQEMAIAVKNDSEGLKDNKRVLEKLYIEKMYWKKRNISFRIYTKDTMNRAKKALENELNQAKQNEIMQATMKEADTIDISSLVRRSILAIRTVTDLYSEEAIEKACKMIAGTNKLSCVDDDAFIREVYRTLQQKEPVKKSKPKKKEPHIDLFQAIMEDM